MAPSLLSELVKYCDDRRRTQEQFHDRESIAAPIESRDARQYGRAYGRKQGMMMFNVSWWSNGKRAACLSLICLLPASSASVFAQNAKNSVTVTPLIIRDLAGVPGKEAVMLTVEYVPGGASVPHRHDAQVFLYVVEGSIVTQVEGKEPVTLTPGQTFYEGPDDIHKTARNASKTEPAKLVVFIVKDAGKPISLPVTSG